jgi:hypothetical protein
LALQINVSDIVWPGGLKIKPDGTKWSSKFRIVVIEEEPFIFKTFKPDNVECSVVQNNSVECPWSHGNFTRNYCCYGYCIDMIRKLSNKLRFNFEMYLVPDGLYGDLVCFALILFHYENLDKTVNLFKKHRTPTTSGTV